MGDFILGFDSLFHLQRAWKPIFKVTLSSAFSIAEIRKTTFCSAKELIVLGERERRKKHLNIHSLAQTLQRRK